jgi:hypothetical protein
MTNRKISSRAITKTKKNSVIISQESENKLKIIRQIFENLLPGNRHESTYRYIQVSQKSRIPNSDRGREGPNGARKILRKKIPVSEEDKSTLILFNT